MAIRLECRNPIFDFDPDNMDIGSRGRRLARFGGLEEDKGTLRFYPDGVDLLVAAPFSGTIRLDTNFRIRFAGASHIFFALGGTYEQEATGFVFANVILLNHNRVYQNATGFAANFGPIISINEGPTIRAQGTARTLSLYNTLRAQPRLGPHLAGGTLAVTNQILFETAAGQIAAGTTVTNRICFRAGGPPLTGGTVTTHVGLDIIDPGIGTTRIGIRSSMPPGVTQQFIDHTGTARSSFAGNVHMNDLVALTLGTFPGNVVQLFRVGAGIMRTRGQLGVNDEALDWDFEGTAGSVILSSPTASNLRFLFAPGFTANVAPGGGGTATLGTVAATSALPGPFITAQATWLEIEIAGVQHFLAAWR